MLIFQQGGVHSIAFVANYRLLIYPVRLEISSFALLSKKIFSSLFNRYYESNFVERINV